MCQLKSRGNRGPTRRAGRQPRPPQTASLSAWSAENERTQSRSFGKKTALEQTDAPACRGQIEIDRAPCRHAFPDPPNHGRSPTGDSGRRCNFAQKSAGPHVGSPLGSPAERKKEFCISRFAFAKASLPNRWRSVALEYDPIVSASAGRAAKVSSQPGKTGCMTGLPAWIGIGVNG